MRGRWCPMAEYVVKGAEPNETVLHSRTPNGYEAWHWLPVRERIVRCRDCRWAHEAPPVDEWHLECRVRPLCRHYTPDYGFCHLGEPKVVDPTTNDVDAEEDA